jgi:anti-sigma factor RsiW
MDCEAYKQWMSRHVDGMLTEEEGAQLDKHLGSCSSCARFRRDLESMRHIFQADPAPAAPAEMSDSLRRAARSELARQRSGRLISLTRRLSAAALLVAAVTAALFLATGTDEIQAGDEDVNIHYEDIFQRAGSDDEKILEILMRTDNPGEALRIYKAEKRQGP